MARKSRKKLFGIETELNLEKEDTKKDTQKTYNTAVYARLSVATSTNEESIENQIAIIKDFIDKNDDLKLTEVYADYGKSGTNFERPEFERMMEDVRNNKIDCIIVKDLSRFGRNFIETGNYIERIFPYIGVRFIAINDNLDTKFSGNDELIIAFKNLLNEFIAKDISKKIQSAKLPKLQEGKFLGWLPPYGFKKDPEDKYKIIPDENTAPIIKKIFEMKAAGKSCMDIVEYLNNKNILTPSEYLKFGMKTAYKNNLPDKYNAVKKWSTQSVLKILHSQRYKGTAVSRKRKRISFSSKKTTERDKSEWIIVENANEPLIDSETFEKVQKMSKNDVKTKNIAKVNTPKEENIFNEVIYCGRCGKKLSFKENSRYRKFYLYNCSNHEKYGNTLCKNKKHINIKYLKEIVCEYINTTLKLEYSRYLCSNTSKPVDEIERKRMLQEYSKILSESKYKKQEIFEQYSKMLINENEFAAKNKNISKIEQNTQRKIDKLLNYKENVNKKYKLKDLMVNEIDKTIVSIFIKRINFYDENIIEIIPNFSDFLGVSESGEKN